jgi:Uma2 family endonuclease
MATITSSLTRSDWTVADLLEHLGGVPADRVRMVPQPGTATEQDLLDVQARTDRMCELIDGVLVEKTMGYLESLLAMAIGASLRAFVQKDNLGIVLGADGTLRIFAGQVRVPDVSFISWSRFAGGRLPDVPIPAVAPDLAVEVLSAGNTEAEMQRKLRDYFAAGVRLVWYIDPRSRTAMSFVGPEQSTVLNETDSLSGGDVLPGFQLSLRELFAEIEGRAR